MIPARPTASALRRVLEDRLASRVPGALTPVVRSSLQRQACGVAEVDEALGGGLPEGAITELVGRECSGRTTVAMAYLAATMRAGNVAAWIDVDDVLDPVSAALCGISLEQLLWVRCGGGGTAAAEFSTAPAPRTGSGAAIVMPLGKPLPGGGCGSPHPRAESRGMDHAIQNLLVTQPRPGPLLQVLPRPRGNRAIGTPSAPNRQLATRSADREEQVPTDRQPSRRAAAAGGTQATAAASQSRQRLAANSKIWQMQPSRTPPLRRTVRHDWSALDQALKATDLILQAGGFSLLVLDLGSTPAEMSWRVPLASWFRFRAACARTQSSLLLLTRHPCARSSAELTVRLDPGQMRAEGNVLTEFRYRAEVERARFGNAPASNVIPMRKPPRPSAEGEWKGSAAWAI